MKISENMLKNFIDTKENIAELTNTYITEVESFNYPFQINNLVIGKVISCEEHPNSDHLHVTKVDIKREILDIVCGAPNVAKDQYVIVALVGATLPGDFIIKPSVIRGVASNGMICSLRELGFEDKYIPEKYSNGIYYFDQNMDDYLGEPAFKVMDLDGFVLELGITPNRSDLLSVLGYAYDLAAVSKKKIILNDYKIKETNTNNPINVVIETDKCSLYYARHFTNITIKESPWWLKSALILNDIRPINNVVDITNYVLLEYGTPLHTFDAKKVKTNQIVVKESKKNDKVITLDEETRTLFGGDILITNGKEPIALGGVMGLLNTKVDDNTTEVILEAACFDKRQVGNTSKELSLRSDSSLRFEKGIDEKRVIMGLERATELLIELADAKVSKGIAKNSKSQKEETIIKVLISDITKTLGTDIPKKEIIDILTNLNYQVKENKDELTLTVPSYRSDITIKADIVEEVARIYGYNNLNSKALVSTSLGALSHKQKRLRKLRHMLADFGLNEVISYTLLKETEVHKFANIGEKLSILQPLTEDRKTVRQSLINGLIETLNYNNARKNNDVNIFEIGNCYAKNTEVLKLAVLLSGSFISEPLTSIDIKDSFYLLKSVLDKIQNVLSVSLTLKKTEKHEFLYPYKQADIYFNEKLIGFIGNINPKYTENYEINPAVVLEIELLDILNSAKVVAYEPVSKYPSITRDIAFIIDEDIYLDEIEALIKQTTRKYLIDLKLFDIYRGDVVGENKKSVAYSLTFNDKTKTLESADVDKLMKSVVNRLEHEKKAVIRK